MNDDSTPKESYLLGHDDFEVARLERQGDLLKPFTERVLRFAGVEPGMRVLDVGCGAGDVSMLVATLVGDTGSVLGIDRESSVIERARARSAHAGNIRYQTATLEALSDETFDVVVSRLVLEYQQDRVSFLRQAAGRVRPGGLLVCMESSVWEGTRAGTGPEVPHSAPAVPLFEQVYNLIATAYRLEGARYETGACFVPLFHEAGLGEPTVHEETLTGGADSPVIPWICAILRSVVPTLERHGVTTADEVGIDSLADRVTAHVRASHSQVRFAPLSGAWLRVPHRS